MSEKSKQQQINQLERSVKTLSGMLHNMITAQQSAWIEWRHGKGAERAMQWIENGLEGPGLLPNESEPWAKEAQAWYNANRTDPFPTCHCGRPSYIYSAGKGYCSWQHEDSAERENP